MTAFLHRDPAAPAGVEIVYGDAAHVAAVRRAVARKDAVIDTIGGTTRYKNSGLETSTAKAIVDAMRAEGVRRLVVVSAMGVSDSVKQAMFW